MAHSREIIIKIKQYIRFYQSNKESNSYYTVIGNTLVRISNHCTWMKTWDNFFKENQRMKGMPIISIVFEDNGNTFNPECLFLLGYRMRPIKVKEFVYQSDELSKQDINLIIKGLQRLIKTNNYIDLTKKCQQKNRISVSPDFSNIEISPDGTARNGGLHGADFTPESVQSNKYIIKESKYTKKNKTIFTEAQLIRVIKNSVKKVLREAQEMGNKTFYLSNGYAIGDRFQASSIEEAIEISIDNSNGQYTANWLYMINDDGKHIELGRTMRNGYVWKFVPKYK